MNLKQDNTISVEFIQNCNNVYSILSNYYKFNTRPQFENFILKSQELLPCEGRVLIEEHENDIFMGLQFNQKIINMGATLHTVTPHEVSVVAEELSHFKFLSDLVEINKSTNRLTLETLGEIDRFLCVMHWNANCNEVKKLNIQWKNIHEICDYVFCGDRFYGEDKNIYIDAENLAFRHLKQAFYDNWDNTHGNFSKCNAFAQQYLLELRNKFLFCHPIS